MILHKEPERCKRINKEENNNGKSDSAHQFLCASIASGSLKYIIEGSISGFDAGALHAKLLEASAG
jgi:hypothetical protein